MNNIILNDLCTMCKIFSDKGDHHLYKEYKLCACNTFSFKLYSDVVKLRYMCNNFWYKVWRVL